MSDIPSIPAPAGASRLRWSVMIPVHNCADYLARALPEVVAQLADRDDAEIIVVDDASTDGPAEVVDRLGRGRVRYVRNERNLGAIATFNKCLELASGELVHLLHGDDAVLPGFYPAMELALAGPDAVAAVCRAVHVDADDTRTYVTRSYRTGTGVWTDALESLAVSNRVRAPAVVVRRSAYQRLGGYRPDLAHAADWEMWTRLAAHGPVVFVDEVLACYRKHQASDTSAMVRTGANIRDRIAAIRFLGRYVPPDRRARTTRRAVAYTIVYACRTSWSLMKAGEWSAGGRQAWEAVRCAVMLPAGLRMSVAAAGRSAH